MTAVPLKALTIANLRGATTPFTLAFEEGKKLTVIYGENGTGKSTICDALDLLGSGVVGSLDGRGLGKTGPFWHSAGKTAGDVEVTLETSASVVRATVGKGSAVVTPLDDRPRVEVLRRGRMLALLEAAPGARYEAVRQFIDVTNVESGEAALRDAIKALEAGRRDVAVRVQEVRDTVDRFWQQAGSPDGDPFAWAAREATRDPGAYDAEITALATLVRSYQRLTDAVEQAAQVRVAVETARDDLALAEADFARSLDGGASDAADLVGLLQAARAHLTRHPDAAVCPLCDSAERAGGLAERVEARLVAFDALRRAQEVVTARRAAFARAAERLNELVGAAARHGDALAQCVAAARFPADTTLPRTALPADPDEWSAWLASSAGLAEAWMAAGRQRVDDKKFVGTLRVILESYQEQLDEQHALDRLLPTMQRALDALVAERRKFTDETLGAIAGEVGRLYEQVHPGEGLHEITLALDPKKRASLDIVGSFGGRAGMPPGAYFSDSHLDTLGLCVFLALAQRQEPADTVLVLDDVLASVDEPHVDRLIEMLYAEAQRFRHCVVTTHYQPWKAKLRWGWLRSGPCQFVELTKWSALGGIAAARSVSDLARLRSLLAEAPPDPQLVCGTAGVVLEAVLDFLTLTYQCAVPRRPDGTYTLGDLLPAVDETLRAALAVDVLGADANGDAAYTRRPLAPYFEALTRIARRPRLDAEQRRRSRAVRRPARGDEPGRTAELDDGREDARRPAVGAQPDRGGRAARLRLRGRARDGRPPEDRSVSPRVERRRSAVRRDRGLRRGGAPTTHRVSSDVNATKPP